MRALYRDPRLCFHNIHYAIKPWGPRLPLWAFAGALATGLGAPTPIAAQQNRAEPIRLAIAEVRAEETKGRPLLERMRQLAAQHAAKKRDYDATDAQLKALQPRLDRYNANIAKFDAQASDYSKRVDAYNARCGGSTPLPQDKYRACLAEKGDLAGRKIELDREKEVLDGEYRAIDGEYKPRSGRLESIRKEMADDAQAFAKVEKDYKAVFDRIEAVKKRLVEMCAAGDQARDPFAVRLCVGAGWDGQKKEFAGLTDLPPPAP